MASILPYLRGTGGAGSLQAQVLYPFTRIVQFQTDVIVFGNGAEQRMANTPALYGFECPMSSLNLTDQGAWLSFFTGLKGRAGIQLQMTLGSVVYSNLVLNDDTLTQTIRTGGRLYDQTFAMRQTENTSWSVPSATTVYPQLQFGTASAVSVAEYPFDQGYQFFTLSNDSPYGPRYSEPIYAGGWGSNFPASYLRVWNIQYSLLTDVDAAAIETAFLGAQGRWITFSFTDPVDGTSSYSHVRFDQDQLAFKYSTLNQQSCSVRLVQTYNS